MALAGCGGGGDAAPAAATGGGGTTTGGTTAPTVTAPTGTAPVTLTATTPAATLAALAPTVTVGGVSIASPPVVSFAIADGATTNNPIIGFGYTKSGDKCTTSSRSTNVSMVPQLTNMAFSLAKLVPGTNGAPSKWVSYIVATPEVYTSATDKTIVPRAPTRPGTENNGTLKDNGNGTYTYTFYNDVTKIKDVVASLTDATGSSKADLGDLTYDATLPHRLTIQISGTVFGTGSVTADCSASGVTAVSMTNPLNVIYDFIPATGKAIDPADATITQRLVVDKASCNDCHGKLGGVPGTDSQSFHSGSRYDPKFCVVCHTDQRKYGRSNAASTALDFGKDSKGVPNSTYISDGVTIGDFPVLIHRVHKGEELIKQNYNYAGVLLNETKFPQDLRNCSTCHDNTAPKVAPQGDNYKKVPSRLACGACHDGIDFAKGTGTTNSKDWTTGVHNTWGHIGGVQADDSKCVLCHDATSIQSVYHIPITPPNANNYLSVSGGKGSKYTNAAWIASNRDNLPSGAIKVDYDIKSVSVNSSKNPVIVFRMLQDGARKDFNANTATSMWDNFFGAPSLYFVWAVTQDGIKAPADFNVSASAWLQNIWKGTGGTLSAADVDGYYTATVTTITVPTTAVMFSGGLGYTYNLGSTPPLTQSNVDETISSNKTFAQTRFGVTSSTVQTTGENKIGGLVVVVPDKQVAATGFTGRRAIVDDALCNKCHKELGLFTGEAFHAGQRNDGSTCSWCHRPNQSSSGWSADSISFVHAIHGKEKRSKPFTWHATAVDKSFADIGYPGILSKCETCHLAGTYDFSATASKDALPNRLYRTVGQGNYAASGEVIPGFKVNTAKTACIAGTASTGTAVSDYALSPYITKSTATAVVNYGLGFSYNSSSTTSTGCKSDGTFYSVAAGATNEADTTTLVVSPIAAACFSCHDSDTAKQHMESNGGSIYRPRGVSTATSNYENNALAKSEQCMLCHSSTSAFGLGIKAVHNK